MIVELDHWAREDEVERVRAELARYGPVHLVNWPDRVLLVCPAAPASTEVGAGGGVRQVFHTSGPAHLTERALQPAGTVVEVGEVQIGGPGFTVIAGPCAVESTEQLAAATEAVVTAGAALLRGGAYKPRTSPYSFQGLEEPGLRMLAEQSRRSGLAVVTEATQPSEVEQVVRWAEMVQVGSRNMQNFALLQTLGRSGRPVLLKRGMAATVEEWLGAAEYLLREGNSQVVLCERGVRTFGKHTRFMLDLSVVPVVKQLTHLPVIVDPSHATGSADLVAPMSLAAAAAGADGLLIDVHTDPPAARCDGPQALRPEQFADLMDQLRRLLDALGRPLEQRSGKESE